MGYSEKKDPNAAPVADATLLDGGWYRAVVQAAELGQYSAKSNNAGRDMLKITFKVLDGDKPNTRLWSNLGNFATWRPTAKNPDGADNFLFFGFWAAIRREGQAAFRRWFDNTEDPYAELELPSELEGRTIRIQVTKAPDAFMFERDGGPEDDPEDFMKNEVRSFKWDDGKSAVTAGSKIAAVEL